MIERHPVAAGELHPLRAECITASVFAAIPGLHPYLTPGQLWYDKAHGLRAPDNETMFMRRGQILEPAVMTATSLEHPDWDIRPAREFVYDPALKLGCSPDFYAMDKRKRRIVVQAKTTTKYNFDKNWIDAPPPWIALQNAVEIMLDDADVGYVVVLIIDGYHFDLVSYEVPRHTGAEQRIRDIAESFWRSVELGIPPKIDYERDGALISLMYPTEVTGKVIDLRTDNRIPHLLDECERLGAEIKDAKALKDTIENEIKLKMEDAESALVRGWRLTFKAQTRKAHQVKESTFRVLRPKREDEAA